jgi:hypothetical protein
MIAVCRSRLQRPQSTLVFIRPCAVHDVQMCTYTPPEVLVEALTAAERTILKLKQDLGARDQVIAVSATENLNTITRRRRASRWYTVTLVRLEMWNC